MGHAAAEHVLPGVRALGKAQRIAEALRILGAGDAGHARNLAQPRLRIPRPQRQPQHVPAREARTQVLRRTHGHQLAVGDDHHVVAHLVDLGQDVAAEDDRVLPAQLADQVADLDDLRRIQAHGGLVQDHHLRIAQYRLRDAHALAVALGQVADQPMHHRRHAGLFRRAPDLRPATGRGHLLEPRHHRQVFLRRHVHVQRRDLRQIADQPLGLLRLLEYVEPADSDLARRGRQTARDDVHRGALARAVGAQKAIDPALLDGEAQIRHRLMGAVALHQMRYFDHVFILLSCASARRWEAGVRRLQRPLYPDFLNQLWAFIRYFVNKRKKPSGISGVSENSQIVSFFFT